MLKVTYNLAEFRKRENCSHYIEKWINGLYKGNTIWLRKSSYFSLLHEVIHFIIRKSLSENNASSLLFRDFIEGVLDFINGIVRYKEWREDITTNFRHYIIETFNDWLDWVLCRN